MAKSFQFAGRTFVWVKEEPGPVLILTIALAMIFASQIFLGDSAAPSSAPAVTDSQAP